MNIILRIATLVFLLSSIANCHSSKKKSLDTHIHGISTLNIAQEGNEIEALV